LALAVLISPSSPGTAALNQSEFKAAPKTYVEMTPGELAAGPASPQQSAGCDDEKLKPYPYESKIGVKNGCTVYHEDFQNTSSGWPNKQGYHYKSGTYEIVNVRPQPGSSYAFDYDHSSVSAM
jgi:hypothetical protein